MAPLPRFAVIMETIRIALIRLREEVILHPFPTVSEEIYFFKHIKTKFCALKIYHRSWFAIYRNMPSGSKKELKKYFEEEINYIRHWFDQHQFYYQYHNLGATEFDNRYFLREAEIPEIWLDELPQPDKDFSVPMEHLFSTIIANRQLEEYLLNKINTLENPDYTVSQQTPALPKLQWTGEQVNLVELIYGIYYTGQINHGNIGVKDIIELMELVFQVKLKSPYHAFGDIRRRKSISPRQNEGGHPKACGRGPGVQTQPWN